MVTVLRGARQACGLLRATSRQESDRLEAVRHVPPDDRRFELRPARPAQRPRLREQAPISSPLPGTTARATVRTYGCRRKTAVYGHFVHRRSGEGNLRVSMVVE
jgi:hypothetical protein